MGLARKVHNMISRAIINLVDDTGGMQVVQIGVYANEVLGDVERHQNFGFTSVPVRPDANGQAEGVVIFPGGYRSHGIVIALDDQRFRLKDMEEGESAQYNLLGDFIKIDKDGNVIVNTSKDVTITAANDVKIDAGNDMIVTVVGDATVTADTIKLDGATTVEGDLQVNGTIGSTGDIDSDGNIIAQGDIDDAAHTLANVVTHADTHLHSGVTTGPGTSGPPTTTVP